MRGSSAPVSSNPTGPASTMAPVANPANMPSLPSDNCCTAIGQNRDYFDELFRPTAPPADIVRNSTTQNRPSTAAAAVPSRSNENNNNNENKGFANTIIVC